MASAGSDRIPITGQVGKVREGRGRKPVNTPETIAKVIDDTRNSTPPDSIHWFNRTKAEHSGLSRATVQRQWKARGLKPHLVKTFNVSNDPNFEHKLVEVVGLHMKPTTQCHRVVVRQDRSRPSTRRGLCHQAGVGRMIEVRRGQRSCTRLRFVRHFALLTSKIHPAPDLAVSASAENPPCSGRM
jgi:hypothetical protein